MGNFFAKNDNSQINYNGEYWEFYEIKIPMNIESIPSIDRVNKITNRGGGETLAGGIEVKPYRLEEYQKKYAVMGIDGKLYWKE